LKKTKKSKSSGHSAATKNNSGASSGAAGKAKAVAGAGAAGKSRAGAAGRAGTGSGSGSGYGSRSGSNQGVKTASPAGRHKGKILAGCAALVILLGFLLWNGVVKNGSGLPFGAGSASAKDYGAPAAVTDADGTQLAIVPVYSVIGYSGDPSLDSLLRAFQNTENSASDSAEPLEIKEKLFATQINDVYTNYQDYLGKTIKYEGVFDQELSSFESGKTCSYVVRYAPGCCPGQDRRASGFEVVWDQPYPEEGKWVEAEGRLEPYEGNGFWALRLALTSLTEREQSGSEFVEM